SRAPIMEEEVRRAHSRDFTLVERLLVQQNAKLLHRQFPTEAILLTIPPYLTRKPQQDRQTHARPTSLATSGRRLPRAARQGARHLRPWRQARHCCHRQDKCL